MNGIAETVCGVLTPHVGNALAELAVRSTAVMLGKTANDLTVEDLPALLERTESMMSGVATRACVEAALNQIQACSW